MRTIENLKTENKELKQLLKESLGPLKDQIEVINKKITAKERHADEYHAELCELYKEISYYIQKT